MTAANNASTNGSATKPPRRLLLISVPRTASNLLVKVLNIHNRSNVLTTEKGGYFFYDAFLLSVNKKKPLDQWADDETKKVQAAFQEAVDSLEEYSKRAQDENKMMFAKEHAFWVFNPASFEKMMRGTTSTKHFNDFAIKMPESYGSRQTFSSKNETVLPDEYLRSWQMAFVIRHPALAWPSLYRAMNKMSSAGFIDEDAIKGATASSLTLRWTRMLYEWCLEQPDVPTQPLVLDAYDVIHNPEAVQKFCERVGLDPSEVQYEWNDKNAEAALAKMSERDRVAQSIMLSTLHASKGVVKDKTPANVDIAAEAEKWKAEFGEEASQIIEKAVRDSMPDYEYLKARRVTV
ncbi:hypothetical protein N7474_004499 [Penicillium riverlandense]|uniref:uncharacterized protein n=1 Tax=Penicillium riverlandense TaxID=1903569 RepID=UPI002548E8C2|nr:uncharacterized protein N7474_004499 [Penicillium riverlandense]KAJ5818908.1 hypothetical protein N7474_004499 [Penicillium riverlandense]